MKIEKLPNGFAQIDGGVDVYDAHLDLEKGEFEVFKNKKWEKVNAFNIRYWRGKLITAHLRQGVDYTYTGTSLEWKNPDLENANLIETIIKLNKEKNNENDSNKNE